MFEPVAARLGVIRLTQRQLLDSARRLSRTIVIRSSCWLRSLIKDLAGLGDGRAERPDRRRRRSHHVKHLNRLVANHLREIPAIVRPVHNIPCSEFKRPSFPFDGHPALETKIDFFSRANVRRSVHLRIVLSKRPASGRSRFRPENSGKQMLGARRLLIHNSGRPARRRIRPWDKIGDGKDTRHTMTARRTTIGTKGLIRDRHEASL